MSSRDSENELGARVAGDSVATDGRLPGPSASVAKGGWVGEPLPTAPRSERSAGSCGRLGAWEIPGK
ncbi:hypothetical protein GCM10010160_58370 [Acrocarpospora corrugata]